VYPQPQADAGYITVYNDSNFGGATQRFSVGQYASLAGSWDDEIESITLTGNVRVILYEKRNWSGSNVVLERNSADLEGFKKKASSLLVEPSYRMFATAFKETAYRESARDFPLGRYPVLDDGWANEIESIDLNGNVCVRLYEKPNFQGLQVMIDQDTPDLSSFKKQAQSIIVEACP
jgi:hypothetical protein